MDSILLEDGFYFLNEDETGGHFLLEYQNIQGVIDIVMLSDGHLAKRITDTFFVRL